MKANTQTAHHSTEAQQKRSQMMTAIFLGALVGVLVGILGMALGVLGSNLLSLFMDTAVYTPRHEHGGYHFLRFLFCGQHYRFLLYLAKNPLTAPTLNKKTPDNRRLSGVFCVFDDITFKARGWLPQARRWER